MKRSIVLLSASHLLLATSVLASSNLIVNGSFEDRVAVAQPERLYAGSNLAGWQVGGQSDSWVYLYPGVGIAKDGIQYLQFVGWAGGNISQVVNLEAGHEYELQFYVAASTDQPRNPDTFGVDVVSYWPTDTLQNSRLIASPNFTASYLGPNPYGSPPWQEFSGTFTALSDQERLYFRFGSLSTSPGFIIDAISLVEIPEPSSCFLGVMAAGIMAVVCRRR